MSDGGGAGRLHAAIDRLAARYGEGSYRAEVASAKDHFFERAGKVFDDDGELFESRLASFLEWYVLERPLDDVGRSPVLELLAESARPDAASDLVESRLTLAALATSHRSLFDVAAVDGHVVELEDLVRGARFRVVERRSTIGFEVADVLEARLLWDGEQVVFGKTFLFHPRDAREEILRLVDGAIERGVATDELLFQLSRLHLRWHRQGHAGAAKVYRGAEA